MKSPLAFLLLTAAALLAAAAPALAGGHGYGQVSQSFTYSYQAPVTVPVTVVAPQPVYVPQATLVPVVDAAAVVDHCQAGAAAPVTFAPPPNPYPTGGYTNAVSSSYQATTSLAPPPVSYGYSAGLATYAAPATVFVQQQRQYAGSGLAGFDGADQVNYSYSRRGLLGSTQIQHGGGAGVAGIGGGQVNYSYSRQGLLGSTQIQYSRGGNGAGQAFVQDHRFAGVPFRGTQRIVERQVIRRRGAGY